MTVASRTVLMQMRFSRAGAPFCEIGAKSTISQVGVTREGGAFFPAVAEITAPAYSTTKNPQRQGASLGWATAKSTIDAHYGRTTHGAPFWVLFSGTPAYTSLKNPQRQGSSFINSTAKSSIDASGFDFTRQGGSYWTLYTGSTPPPFNTTRFFLMF